MVITDPLTSPTNVLAAISYYQTNELYLNQFSRTFDSFGTIKNLFLSTQICMIHVNQIKYSVDLSISYNTAVGENLFRIDIDTNHRVEIKECIIPLTIKTSSCCDEHTEISILQRTIYIEGIYFMTYAIYINDVLAATKLDTDTDPRQVPLQLATMILFAPVIPIINLDIVIPTTEQERMLVKLYKEVLKQTC